MHEALARHDTILRQAVEANAGHLVKTTGDGIHAVFGRALDGVQCAIAAQLAVRDGRWETTGPLRVRMGLHTGEAFERDGDYYGAALNRAARLMGVAHAGADPRVECDEAAARGRAAGRRRSRRSRPAPAPRPRRRRTRLPGDTPGPAGSVRIAGVARHLVGRPRRAALGALPGTPGRAAGLRRAGPGARDDQARLGRRPRRRHSSRAHRRRGGHREDVARRHDRP